jgi:hypothetical protein
VPVLFFLTAHYQPPTAHCRLPVLVLNINLRYIGGERTKVSIVASENMPIAETLLLRQHMSLSFGDSQ